MFFQRKIPHLTPILTKLLVYYNLGPFLVVLVIISIYLCVVSTIGQLEATSPSVDCDGCLQRTVLPRCTCVPISQPLTQYFFKKDERWKQNVVYFETLDKELKQIKTFLIITVVWKSTQMM